MSSQLRKVRTAEMTMVKLCTRADFMFVLKCELHVWFYLVMKVQGSYIFLSIHTYEIA